MRTILVFWHSFRCWFRKMLVFCSHFQALIADKLYSLPRTWTHDFPHHFSLLYQLRHQFTDRTVYKRRHNMSDRRQKTCDRRRETWVVRQETWDRTLETGDMRQETWGRRRETGEVGQETWDRRRETGDVRQETWDRRHETGDMR